jgi:hypothetical protein
VAPRQRLAAAPAASAQTATAGPATARLEDTLEDTAGDLRAAAGDTPPGSDLGESLASAANATTADVRPLLQVLTINF